MARQAKRRWSWHRQAALLNSALTLAAWRWRQQWFLLLITGVGITLAIALVGSLPLFSGVMTTAGLRNVLRAQPNSAQIIATTNLPGFSSSLVQQATDQVNSVVQEEAGTYLLGKPQIAVQLPAWHFPLPDPRALSLYGVPLSTVRSHVHLLQGRLPVDSGSHLEILLTPSTAQQLHLRVGDHFTLQPHFLRMPSYMPSGVLAYSPLVTLQVVGLFQPDRTDPYWDGTNFDPLSLLASLNPPPSLGLTSSAVLLHFFDALAQQQQAAGMFTGGTDSYSVSLSYWLNTATITSHDLDDLITQLYTLQQGIATTFNVSLQNGDNTQAPYISSVALSGPTLSDATAAGGNASTLEKFRNQEFVENTPALLLTIQVICLILFFVSLMASALVEQQQQAIAVMRSRGASRQQILGSLIAQGVGLCLLAGLAGPVLALGLVVLTAPLFLTPSTRDALNTLVLNPWQTLSGLGVYTAAAVAATLATLIFALSLAMRATILTQRREQARATSRPLWQRLQLDLVIAVLALLSYVLAVSVEGTSQALSAQAQALVSVPLELLAPLLLVVAGILCFLRLFPSLLRLLARATQRGDSLSSMLALVQMERAPRQSMRMALLLGLATAFALFALVFSASQGQRAQDLATYQASSDFSGALFTLPTGQVVDPMAALARTTATYQQITGVNSVTAGSMETVYLTGNGGTANAYGQEVVVQAVNAQTFGQTANWTTQDSSRPLGTLMAQLVAQRQQASAQHVVPALVAASTWQFLGLHPGSLFHLTDAEGNPNPITYLALAEVAHIPPVDDSSQGAVLVDYQTLASASVHLGEAMQPNYVWLRSSDTPVVVAHIRAALASGTLNLVHLLDRRALAEANTTDPLAVDLITILSIGVAAALLLALLANVLLPALSVRTRLTNFAVLRALGTGPAQVTRILLWEQGIVLGTALLLGLLFGLLLAFTAVSPLIFTSASPTSALFASNTAIFALQRIIPVTITLPPSLGLALATLIVMCLLALQVLTHLVQRPLLGQTLRLNED